MSRREECPWCEQANEKGMLIMRAEELIEGDGVWRWCVACVRCGCRGPLHELHIVARRAWLMMPRRQQETVLAYRPPPPPKPAPGYDDDSPWNVGRRQRMTCPKCNGIGRFDKWKSHDNGKCYRCNGTGAVWT